MNDKKWMIDSKGTKVYYEYELKPFRAMAKDGKFLSKCFDRGSCRGYNGIDYYIHKLNFKIT